MNSTKLPLINKNGGEQDDVKKHYKCSCNSILILTFLFIVFITLVFFLLLHLPRWPIITIQDASIKDEYTFTTHHHLNAAFKFTVKVHNPNTKLSLYYDHIEFKAYHGGQIVGYDGVQPFLQPHENMTLLSFGGVASDMPLFEPKQGEVNLVLELKGRLWFKAGSLSLYWYNMKTMCYPVVVFIDPTRDFERSSICYLMVE